MQDFENKENIGPRTEIIGVTRFSHMSEGGYQRPFEDLEQQAKFLYDEKRLSRRLTFFENLMLPSLRAQTNQDYRHILMTGEAIPTWAEDRVLAAIEGLPVSLVKKPPMRMKIAVNEVIEESFSGKADIEIAYRMDDDDAMSKHFIQQLYDRIPMAQQILALNPKFVYYWRKGFMLDVSGELPIVDPVVLNAPIGLTLAMFRRRGNDDTPYNHGHYNIVKHIPSFVEADRFGFIRSIHEDCDIRHGANKPYIHATKLNFDLEKHMGVLFEDFGMSEENLELVMQAAAEAKA